MSGVKNKTNNEGSNLGRTKENNEKREKMEENVFKINVVSSRSPSFFAFGGRLCLRHDLIKFGIQTQENQRGEKLKIKEADQ